MTERHRAWPPYFDEWPRGDQVAYLLLRYQRDDLIREIGRRAGIQSLIERDMDPSTARISKDELAELALFLGVHHGAHSNNPDQPK